VAGRSTRSLDSFYREIMRLTCYPTVWDEAKGLVPVEAQDLQITASPNELRAFAKFLNESAAVLEVRPTSSQSETFEDSKPNPKTGISISVSTGIRNDQEAV